MQLSLESATYSDALPYFTSLKSVLDEFGVLEYHYYLCVFSYDTSDPSDAIAPYVTNLIAQFLHRLQGYLDDSLVHKVRLVAKKPVRNVTGITG